MKRILLIALLICYVVSQKVESCPANTDGMKCSNERIPVCGVKLKKDGTQKKATFTNHCMACAIGHADFSVEGRCKDYPCEAWFCSPQDKQAQFCTEEYNPHCAWNDYSIQCLVYPCASTQSNKCFACQGENVLYATKGDCPSSG